MRRRRSLAVLLALLACPVAVGAATQRTFAAFGGSSSNASTSLAAAADWTPPSASRTAIAKSTGGEPGYIRPGGTYYAYAQVSDGGNPPAGVASVSADAGLGPVALTSTGGPWTVGGQDYNHRSALQTLPAAPDGTYPFTLALSDSSSPVNSGTQGGFSVTVDGAPPSASDVQTANGGSTAGRAEQDDRVLFTFSEPIEPASVLAGWDGTATTVTLRIANAGGSDRIQVRNAANTAQLPMTNANGVSLGRTDYVTANRDFTGSTMVRSGPTVTITLGTPSATTGFGTVTANSTMSWAPLATITDRAGNPASTAAVNETGPADREL